MGSSPENQNKADGEKSVIKALGLLGGSGVPCAVDTKNDKIIRVRPLHYDWKFSRSDINPWKIQKNGKTLEPILKSLPSPFSLAYKKRAYSPNRIKYPLKRVDWDPDGERHPENRGKSKYRRISWDEATDIIAAEIRRLHGEYGPYSILVQGDGHGEAKNVHIFHGAPAQLLDRMGGYTQQIRNPDSWEGWYWGSKHVWGEGYRGLMRPAANLTKDISENSEIVLVWGGDPETTPWGFSGQTGSLISYFWSDIGIKQVYICPDLNYGAAIHADKWIPVLPNTDAALQLAVIYNWISEGTYDKDYVATHTEGFDRFKAYVMGEEDGIPKTPAWASQKCGVPEWTIKALARDFAAKATTIVHYYGGSYIRGPFSHEPARLECILLGMQGLGKPGVHQCQISFGEGMPRSAGPAFITGSPEKREKVVKRGRYNLTISFNTKQGIPKTLLQEAILNPPITFWGSGAISATTEDQFVKYTYPIAAEEGGTEIRMIWTDTPCRTTCWNDGNKTVEAMRSPKIECIVAQHPWLENDCLLADIILPVNTTLEEEDIVVNGGVSSGGQPSCITLQRQAMTSIGESMSDYQTVVEVAKKLGLDEAITGGNDIEDLIRRSFENFRLPEYTTWEEFSEKGYHVFPTADDWENDTPGMRDFYEDPEANPLLTPSGKLEFYSERLAEHFPDDTERPPMPKWIEKSETHDERISSDRARMFPLLMMSNHGRWRVHSQCDDISWTREALTCKVKGWDGYMYEPLWINPSDAASRGIKNGDIVKAYNERGVVLCGALVWERVMPGVVYVDHGARADFIIPGKLDRGGAINLISPVGLSSKNAAGQATSSYLVEVERVTISQMQAWMEQFPEAFQRDYDPASGLRFDGWIEKDNG